MGIFDFFKKSTESYKEELSLEMLLQKAAGEPAYRAEFYKRLLSDNLVVITQKSHLQPGSQILEKDTEVEFVAYEDGKIPIFTSTERIFDKGVVKTEVQYMQMKGENLFQITKGATFLLNPYSDYGKELLPDEVERLLSGRIFEDSLTTRTIEKDTEVQIGQPAKYPTEIIESLKILYSGRSNVKAAYLGWIFTPGSGEPAHYIFGIDAEGDLTNLNQEAGFIAKKYLAREEFVDFIRIDKNNGISDYFINKTEPFYKQV